MNTDDYQSEQEDMGESLTNTPDRLIMQPMHTTFTSQASGSGRIINVNGGYTTHNHKRIYIMLAKHARDGASWRRRRRRHVTRLKDVEDAESQWRWAQESTRERRVGDGNESPNSGQKLGAAVMIQLSVGLETNGQPWEAAQIAITYRVAAVSTGVLFFF